MPLVIGAAAIAFILMGLLTLITLYWVLTKWHDFAQGIPVVGGALANMAAYLRDRNEELIRAVFGFAHAIISWSIDRIVDGFHLLHDIYNQGVVLSVTQLINQMFAANGWIRNYADGAIHGLLASMTELQAWRVGFVNLNIDALNFWRKGISAAVDLYLVPQVNKLIHTVDIVTGLTIPTIQVRLGVAERTIQQTLPAEIAETKTDISAVQRVISQTTTAPGTGLLDRALALEGKMAQVLPWAAAIGLSIPIARTLARVGRNPCTCLEEDGQTDMLPLLMYLFTEAG